MAKAFHSRHVKVNGFKTHYIEAGEGEPLLLIHGGDPGTSGEQNWHCNIPMLAEHFHVYAIDLLGYGYSDKPRMEYSEEADVRHLEAFADTFYLDRLRIAGNSRGAFLSAKFALNYPDRVKHLMMIGTGILAIAMGLPWGDSDGMRAVHEFVKNPTRANLRHLLETQLYNEDRITDEMVNRRFDLATQPTALAAQAAAARYRERRAKDPNLQQLLDIRLRLPRLTIPICLIWGREDRMAPVELAYKLRELLPNLKEFHILENSGHLCQIDAFARFNDVALQFFLS